ncbi:hypothetical protein A1O7_07203 [Cladophialophora yegresii CBS 114405]|uniref:Transcription factor domain-containing protein n=1 Tax=Cladophialophora yegresii CBS 114405 TaxID=1182544 RepID=W9WEC0_9EURO|nr:uncharacterized protein A1O7_07203 [Cladophialophora yegresii CBS 114405]EXJ56859.1 hypothetical protein A1O7_07203 [Cladophialophora yegresii CBS 114405]
MPPKANRSKSPDPQYLFVNEDASTVTRTTKDAELDRTKQSHVQRQNFARKRRLREGSDPAPQASSQSSVHPSPTVAAPASLSSQEALPDNANYFDILQNIDLGDPFFPSTGPPSVFQSPLDPSLSALLTDPFAATPRSPPTTPYTENFYGPSQSYRAGHYFDVPQSGSNITQSLRNPGEVTSPPAPLARVSSVPTSTHRALEQWAPPLIKHYNTVVLPEKFWKDTQKVPLAEFRHAALIHADMRACMAEPAHMYALLATAAAQMVAREGRLLVSNVPEDETQRVPTFFKTKAIQALRAKLGSGQLDHHTAVDTHRLYAACIHSNNDEAAEPHFQALISMVAALGGLSTFDDYQLENFYIVDCISALKRLGIPRLIMTLDPGPPPEEILSPVVSQSPRQFPPGSMLETLLQTSPQCIVLSESIVDLMEVARVSAYLNSTSHYDEQHYRWFSWRILIILHKLLSLPLHCEMDEKTDSARIAAAFWTALLRSPAVGRRAASRSVATLHARLQNTDLGTLWQPRTDCLLWISVFGGICCAQGEELDWFVQLARTAAIEIGLGNARELEDVLMAFLYDPHSQKDLVLEFAARMWPSR